MFSRVFCKVSFLNFFQTCASYHLNILIRKLKFCLYEVTTHLYKYSHFQEDKRGEKKKITRRLITEWRSVSVKAVESSPLGPFEARLEKVQSNVVGIQC